LRALADKDGKPLLSWRVLLLPYLDEGAELYREFRLDEAWDSPHNLRLVPRMPSVFAPPPGRRARLAPGHTVCHVFIGPETPFAVPTGPLIPYSYFPSSPSNTFLIVEAGKPIPWTKPQELVYYSYRPLPDLTGLFEDGFRAATADGAIYFVKNDMEEDILRSAISPHHVRKDVEHNW